MKQTQTSHRGIFNPVLITLCAGIILSCATFFYIRSIDARLAQNEFNVLASDRSRILVNGISNTIELLRSVRYLYASSVSVERDEFKVFVNNILSNHPEIFEFRWLPRVSNEERINFESRISSEGLGNYTIKEGSHTNQIETASLRDEYFPILYVEPWSNDKLDTWGLDSFSFPERKSAIQKCIDANQPILRCEITLVGEPGLDYATRIYLPVYKNDTPIITQADRQKNIEGVLVVLFSMDTLAQNLLKDIRGRGLDTYIFDSSTNAGDRLVLFDASHTREGKIRAQFTREQLKKNPGISWEKSFLIADTSFTIISTPAPKFLNKVKSKRPWIGLTIGLFLTFIFALYLDTLMQRSRTIDSLVKQKTQELTKAYEQLKTAQLQVLQTSKMAAVGQLAGGVAHEINNPLTSVINNIQIIKMTIAAKKDFSQQEFQDLMETIESSAMRCKKITRALLDFSHSSKEAFEVTSINLAAEKVISLIKHELKLENITLQQELDPQIPDILGDTQLLQQVILDLILNARWAIKKLGNTEKGTITIKTWHDEKNKRVCASISDTGIGIPQENIARIFEPFFTTKDVGEGTGLGLALVFNIITSHKGTIEVKSSPGQGATFTLSFPIPLSKTHRE